MSLNVFSDLGLPDAEDLLAKAKLAAAVVKTVKERGLTQKEAAEIMKIDQPKVSKILGGKLSDFSAEWLLTRLLLLGLDIDIIVHESSSGRPGVLKVASA